MFNLGLDGTEKGRVLDSRWRPSFFIRDRSPKSQNYFSQFTIEDNRLEF